MSVLLSSIIVKALAVIFIAACGFGPLGLKAHAAKDEDAFFPMLVITFYLCAALAFAALFLLNRLLKNIKEENIFVEENVKILRGLSWCCYFVGIVTAVYSIWEYPFMVIAAAAAFFGLILRVLKNVFCKAVEIREENDGTI